MKHLLLVISVALLGGSCMRTNWRSPDERIFAELSLCVSTITETYQNEGIDFERSIELANSNRSLQSTKYFFHEVSVDGLNLVSGFGTLRRTSGIGLVYRKGHREIKFKVISLQQFVEIIKSSRIDDQTGEDFLFAD